MFARAVEEITIVVNVALRALLSVERLREVVTVIA